MGWRNSTHERTHRSDREIKFNKLRDARDGNADCRTSFYKRSYWDIIEKIIDITYEKADLKQVANNATQLNAEERNKLLSLLKEFEDLFDGNLGDWDTEPVDLGQKPGSKLFNSKYYTVHRINKETFIKELKHLVKIGVLTPVKHSQYGNPVFIIPKK